MDSSKIKKAKILALETANAEVLVEIALSNEGGVSEALKMKVYEKLMGSKEGQSFFKTMLEEALTWGECPHCKHENHWLIPEEDLSQMGFVSYKEDPRCDKQHDAKTCPEYQQAHWKKKITI